jgi:hypothetical protein
MQQETNINTDKNKALLYVTSFTRPPNVSGGKKIKKLFSTYLMQKTIDFRAVPILGHFNTKVITKPR